MDRFGRDRLFRFRHGVERRLVFFVQGCLEMPGDRFLRNFGMKPTGEGIGHLARVELHPLERLALAPKAHFFNFSSNKYFFAFWKNYIF